MGPLVEPLQDLHNPDFAIKDVHAATTDVVCLLDNASSQISCCYWKRISKAVNPEIQDLANEEDVFKTTAPNLLRGGFKSKMKKQAESLKLLSAAKAHP